MMMLVKNLSARCASNILLAGLLASVTQGCGRPAVDLGSVLSRMSDPAGFAVPVEGRTAMVSTYDRTGGNMDWGDWSPAKSVGGEQIVADLDGPGCLTRLWTTGCEPDEWRLYVDDDVTPRIRGAKSDIFGKQAPVLPPMADQFSGAAHSYLPVPFAGRLRVTAYIPKLPAGARPYYHLGYTSLDRGTKVASFPATFSDRDTAAIARLREAWDSVEASARSEVKDVAWRAVAARPGVTSELVDIRGGGTITAFAVRIKGLAAMSAVDRPKVLRSLVLECRWDGSDSPSVEVPLGDFFCNGLAFRSFASLPLANVDGTFISRFPMPFRTGARIGVRNDGGSEVAVETWHRCDRTWKVRNPARYFHAAWSSAMANGGPFRVMRTEGSGHFVGCYLISLGMDGRWNILEGDETFRVDGELQPSWHGTGLEDYFNGGWYYYGLFERALFGLLEKAAMRTAQYRFHISDPVRFTKSLEMQFEFGDANRALGYMSASSYWYQDKPSPANSSIPALSQRFPPLDRVGMRAAMSELFELEKAGLLPEAIERCRYYEAMFAGTVYGPMFGLRGIAYGEAVGGPPAARPLCAAIAARTDVPAEVAAQARLLHWLGDGPNRALLGAQAPGLWRLYWDGVAVGEGSSPFEFKAFPVEATPGEHWIHAEVTPQTPGAFFSACLRAAFSNVTTDLQWEFAREKPDRWPGSGGAGWKPLEIGLSMFPQMAWWQFVPNAFVGMQHGWQVIQPYSGWDQPPGRTVYLRRKVVVPADEALRQDLFPRRKEIRTPPWRPMGDTSNDGLTK